MMKSIGMKSLLMLLLTALLSSTVSSSFVPSQCIARLSKSKELDQKRIPFLSLNGGSDEPQDIEGAILPPAPVTPDMAAGTSPPPPVVEAPPMESNTAALAPSSSSSKLGPKASTPGFLRKTFPTFPWYRLPNLLTYVRCLAIPALIVIFYQPDSHVVAGVLFAIASFTDWLDGYLARRWDITSPFGAFLDPVADKLMVSTSLILLAGRYGPKVAVPAAIILAREIGVSALREWMASKGQRNIVKVGFQGKVKTALTMVALTVLLFVPTVESGLLSKLYTPGLIMLYLSTVVTITSGSVYFLAAAPLLMEEAQ